MAIIFAAPAAPPAPPSAPAYVKTRVTWTGHDGSFWDLTDWTSGVALLRDGVEGLHLPRFREWVRQSPAVPGQWFTGAIAEPRTVVLPIAIWEDSTSLGWIERDRAFWKSMHPRRTGTLTVAPAGTGQSRSIRLRLVPDVHVYDIDPGYDRWAAYVVPLVADQPFWEGQPRRFAWNNNTDPLDFYEETGPQLINLMSGHTTGNATVVNDGDEDAWPAWTVIGDATTSHVGVGTALVDIPFAVAAGKALVLDTDPRVQTAMEYDYTPAAGATPEVFANPVDRTADLTGDTNFAPIPAGGSSAVNIALSGTGQIRMAITPLYWRAW